MFDSGCSVAVTPYENEFIGFITKVHKSINGLSASIKVVVGGKMIWSFRDDYGVSQKFKMWAFLIPTSTVRLFGLQEYFKQEGKELFLLSATGCIFEFLS